MVIGGYFVSGYWWLLIVITLVATSDYYINGYWWIFYWSILVVINGYW